MSYISKDFIEDLSESGEMGENLVHIELSTIEYYKEGAWTYLRVGSLVPFMQCIEGYNKVVSM